MMMDEAWWQDKHTWERIREALRPRTLHVEMSKESPYPGINSSRMLFVAEASVPLICEALTERTWAPDECGPDSKLRLIRVAAAPKGCDPTVAWYYVYTMGHRQAIALDAFQAGILAAASPIPGYGGFGIRDRYVVFLAGDNPWKM